MNLRHGLTLYSQLQSGVFDAVLFSAIRLNKYRSQQLHTFKQVPEYALFFFIIYIDCSVRLFSLRRAPALALKYLLYYHHSIIYIFFKFNRFRNCDVQTVRTVN